MKMKVQRRKPLLRDVWLILNFISSLWVYEGSSNDSNSQVLELEVPCFFIFGDSMSDSGNNNDNPLILARADYRPYGIDFPYDSPTGRFTNGLNLADFIAKFLGFDNFIPPFKTASGHDILKGVNYASGASGILDISGTNLGQITSLSHQLNNHDMTSEKIRNILGSKTEEHLKKCMYMVAIGSNDYINNYLLPSSNNTTTPLEFAMSLTNALSQKLKSLYEVGARKVAIFGVGGIGCTPYARANFPTNGSPCVDSIDNATQLFNDGLKPLVDQLNADLPNASFIFIDVNHIATALLQSDGMVSDRPCCEVAGGGMQCIPDGKVCSNRFQYLFWDAIHPTEIVYGAIARRAFNALSLHDSYPFDINKLSQF